MSGWRRSLRQFEKRLKRRFINMRMTRERKNLGVWIVLAALSVWSMAVYAQSSQTGDGAWQWSAELVSFDEATRMLTVKAMAVGDAARQVSAVKSGEKVMITW